MYLLVFCTSYFDVSFFNTPYFGGSYFSRSYFLDPILVNPIFLLRIPKERDIKRQKQTEGEIPQLCFVAQQLNTTQFCRKTVKYSTFCREMLQFAFRENDSGSTQDRRKSRKLCHLRTMKWLGTTLMSLHCPTPPPLGSFGQDQITGETICQKNEVYRRKKKWLLLDI